MTTNNSMLIIGIQNTKGGATKSTTSVNIARGLQLAGQKVALGETDSQGTLREWRADNDGQNDDLPLVVDLRDRQSILEVRSHPEMQDIDVLLIDGAANNFPAFLAVAKVADFVVIVAQPSSADFKPIEEMVDVLHDKGRKTAFLLTRTKKGDDYVEEARGVLEAEFPYPVLKNTIRDLKGFRTTFGAGQTVFEYPAYKRGQEDIVAVIEELWENHLVEV